MYVRVCLQNSPHPASDPQDSWLKGLHGKMDTMLSGRGSLVQLQSSSWLHSSIEKNEENPFTNLGDQMRKGIGSLMAGRGDVAMWKKTCQSGLLFIAALMCNFGTVMSGMRPCGLTMMMVQCKLPMKQNEPAHEPHTH